MSAQDTRRREHVLHGVCAGVLAWAGMAGWALLGVTLLGLGAAATPAAVALAAGGSAGFDRGMAAGTVSALPLGVSLPGAFLLTAWLTSWPRVAGAAASFVAGLAVLPFLPAGQFDVRFWPTLAGGLGWLAVVLGLRVATWWAPRVRRVLALLAGAGGVAVVVGAAASVPGGARVLGTVLLAAPNLLCVALTRGLGVPWRVHGPGLPLPAVETGWLEPLALPVWPLTALAAVLVVLVAVAAGWHTPWVTAVWFAAMAWAGGATVDVAAGPLRFSAGMGGDVPVAAAAGLAAGAVACLLVAAARYWHRRRT